MNWDAIRNALKLAVQQQSGLTAPGAVEWKDQSSSAGWRGPAVANMSHTGERTIGCDEVRGTFNPGTQQKDILRCGNRQFDFTVRFEIEDASNTAIAAGYASKLRTRLFRPYVGEQLRAAGISIVDVKPTVAFDFKQQDRMLSVAVVEITFNAAENDTDDSPGAGNWIQSVSAQGQWTEEDGSTLSDDVEVP
jgi:hypothetical protein